MNLLDELDQEDRVEMACILSEYRSRQKKLKIDNPEHDGWVPRISELDGVESDHLSRLHGQLIAWGCLKFQIANRSSGVVYQISPEGKNMLEDGFMESSKSSHDPAA